MIGLTQLEQFHRQDAKDAKKSGSIVQALNEIGLYQICRETLAADL